MAPRTPPFALLLAPGWKRVSPRSTEHRIAWNQGGQAVVSGTDFASLQTLGEMSPNECPIAVNGAAQTVYCYNAPGARVNRDYSEIRAYSLREGTHERIFRLGLNQWMNWAFSFWTEKQALFGLVATDMPGEGVNIQHQLGVFDVRNRRSLLLPLPRDAFYPLAINYRLGELMFHGAEGYQRVKLNGRRIAQLSGKDFPSGLGASYHPTRPVVALGGDGVTLWNFENNTFEKIQKRGCWPVWSVDGTGVWFRHSSSDLLYYDCETQVTTRVLTLGANPYPELKYARAPVLTSDGRYLAVGLTSKFKRTEVDENQGRSAFAFRHGVAVVSLRDSKVWSYARGSHQLTWIEGNPNGI